MADRLNLSALRGRLPFPVPAPPPHQVPPTGNPSPPLGVVQGQGTVTFTLGGQTRWLVDAARFAGTPTLTLTAGSDGSRLTLAGARLPGTDLPADFVVLIGKTGPTGTPADFTFTLGGFHGQVILEDWLAGVAALQSPVALSGDICPLGAASKLAFTANGEAGFTPDWQMEITGTDVATISGLGPALPSGRLTVQLLAPTDPGISGQPSPARTALTMLAGANTWSLTPEVTRLPIGTLGTTPGAFTSLAVEAGEGPGGVIARELIAVSSGATGLTLNVAGGFTDQNGHRFTLSLASPMYGIAFDSSPDHSQGDQTGLIARFSTSGWLVVDGFALLVCDAPAAPGFDCYTLNGKVTSLQCAPALVAAAAPLGPGSGAGVAATPLLLTGATLPFVAAPGTTPGWGIIAGPEKAGRRRFSLPDFSVSVLRRDDLLALDFQCFNLAMEGGGGTPAQLVVKDTTEPGYLVAQFNSPQNIAEQAYLEGSPDTKPPHQAPPSGSNPPDPQSLLPENPDPPGAVQTRAAGPSRLAFQLPAGTTALPYSLDSLLDWVALQQHVVSVAAVPDVNQPDPGQVIVPQPQAPTQQPQISQPSATQTAIEAPWRLILSPNYSGAWAHSPTPVTLSERTELWHTRLAVRTRQGGELTADETIPRRVRAVWSPDYTAGTIPGHPAPPFDPKSDAAPFRMSLDPDDRDQIVRLSSDFTLTVGTDLPYVPISIAADKLYLSTLGAWIELFGSWPDQLPPDFSVLQWQHRATLGRDNYVRVVYAGYLLPFGNEASLVKVTERKLQSVNGAPATTAYLRQKFFVIVRQPTVSFQSLTDAQQRHLPYRSITITTLVTPDVFPSVAKGPDNEEHYSFFPISDANPFLFHIVGTDWDGNTSEFSAPLYFVELGGDYTGALGNYNNSGAGKRPLAGQHIAFVPSVQHTAALTATQSDPPGSTALQAQTLTFSAQPQNPSSPLSPFFPQMEAADVVVPAIQQLTGGPGAMSIEFFTDYVKSGMGPGEVFANITDPTALSVQFNGKQSGGVATPNLTVAGLSRQFGTVSSDLSKLSDINSGTFDPANIFGDPTATLFGFISLADLFKLLPKGAQTEKLMPKLTTKRQPDQITTTLTYSPGVPPSYSTPNRFITLTFTGDLSTALSLQAEIVVPLKNAQPGKPRVSIQGELNHFTLELANVVAVTITQIAFKAPAGEKMSVTATLPSMKDKPPPEYPAVHFEGDLSFLNALEKFIPSDGFDDPPSLEVSDDGITAGYSLPIPNIGVGVFSLENIGFKAALTLPFVPLKPIRFRFNFAERQHPFNVTVSLLGGGGFFGIAIGPDGVEILEASIEVGANVSIDVTVASGNVHIMAGVYLKYVDEGTGSQLTGYLRAGGTLEVLGGVISASVEFYLGFTYYFGPPCRIAGEVTITIEVHVLFFSASVKPRLYREFGDPTISFAELIGPSDWDTYCDAFAA